MSDLKKILFRVYSAVLYIFHSTFGGSLFKKNVNKWFVLDGDKKYLTNHKLTEDSIVFEIGGYTGVFSDEIIRHYNCYMYVFEPVKEYYEILIKKYKDNTKIKVFQFGLSNVDENVYVSRLDNATSVYKNEGIKEQIKLIDFKTFITQEKLDNARIDLISINIEGGEYGLLSRISETYPNMIKKIQVQFHDFIDDSEQKRLEIIKKLHNVGYKRGYSFPFVWELFIKEK